jgi:hypothetical protein
MKTSFRITDTMLRTIHTDLDRPHKFAAERVGFVTCGVADLPNAGLEFYAGAYHPVADEDYLEDDTAGAMLGPAAFRKMLQFAYRHPSAVFHVHRHEQRGRPSPSRMDDVESRKFIPDFWKVCPRHPHGILILSLDSIYGRIWHLDRQTVSPLDSYFVVGDSPTAPRGALDERA